MLSLNTFSDRNSLLIRIHSKTQANSFKKNSLPFWILNTGLRHLLQSVFWISEDNIIFHSISLLCRIQYPAPTMAQRTWLNPWCAWCFPLNLPQFLYNQSQSISSLQVCGPFLLSFVFRNLIRIHLHPSRSIQFPHTTQFLPVLQIRFLHPFIIYLVLGSQNTTNIPDLEWVITANIL